MKTQKTQIKVYDLYEMKKTLASMSGNKQSYEDLLDDTDFFAEDFTDIYNVKVY